MAATLPVGNIMRGVAQKAPLNSRAAAAAAAASSPAGLVGAARSRVQVLGGHLRGSPPASALRPGTAARSVAAAAASGDYTYPFGQAYTVEPEEEHTASVIWLHGLGDTGAGWSEIGRMLGLPHIRFIFPTAPTRPITLNMGMQMPGWYDLADLGDLLEGHDDEAGILESVNYVKELAAEEEAKGIDPSKIVVAGFSQGGAVALTAALRWDGDIGGCIALSTYLPLRSSYPKAQTNPKGLPLLMCHGTRDMVVGYQYGASSAKLLEEELGLEVDFQAFEGMGHEACQEEFAAIAQFLSKQLPKA